MAIRWWAILVVLLTMALRPLPGWAATYYVDPVGSDSATGLSQAVAWRTLARVNAAWLSVGDAVYLKRGGIWRESLIVPSTGITYGAYGSGADPVISGSDVLTAWAPAGSYWYAPLAAKPHDVWFGEIRGRYRTSLTAMTKFNDWWWSATEKRLYVRANSRPASAQAAVRPKPIETQSFNAGLGFTGIAVQGYDMTAPFGSGAAWNCPPGPKRSSSGPVPSFHVGLTSWEGGVWSAPIWYAASTDPLVDVLYLDNWWQVASGQWRRYGNSAAVESTIRSQAKTIFPYRSNVYSSQSTNAWVLPSGYDPLVNPPVPPRKVRASATVVPATAADGHLVIVQPDGRVLECFGAIRLSTGQIVCGRYQIMEPWRQGDWWMNGLTASMIPMFAGLIRDEEAYRGDIKHALQVRIGAQALTPLWVFPAAAFDRDAMSNGTPYSGPLPMGTRLALPASIDPDAIPGVTSKFGKMMARAMKLYGAIIVDRGGSHGITIGVETGVTHPDFVNYSYARQLEIEAIFELVQRAE